MARLLSLRPLTDQPDDHVSASRMTVANLASLVSDAWEMVLTLSRYGDEPLTVGWWRGDAYVKLWDYRTGNTTWRPFTTSRPESPLPPHRDLFSSRYLWKAM